MERENANTDARSAAAAKIGIGERQIRAAELLVAAMAVEQAIRPIVTGFQTEILARHQWHADPAWKEGSRTPPEAVLLAPILDPKHTYLLSEEDFGVYCAECYAAALGSGIKPETVDHCPLLIAEHNRRKAERLLLLAMDEIVPGIARARFSLEKRQTATELSLNLCAPLMRSGAEILQRIEGGRK